MTRGVELANRLAMDVQEVVSRVHHCPLEEVAKEAPEIVGEQPLAIFALAKRIGETGDILPEEVGDAFAAHVPDLKKLSPQTFLESVTEVLVQPHVETALEWLYQIGFIREFYPELEATRHLQQEPGRHHKDVWEHTKLVVKQAIPKPTVRWGALLHDIGKVPTRRFTKTGVHFHGHAEVGARMFDKIARRQQFHEELRRPVRFLIKYHLRSAQYDPSWTDSAVRRFAREMDAHLEDLLALSRADITSKRPGRRKELLAQIHTLATRIKNLRAQDEKKPNLPKGLGTAIMERFDLPASRQLGNLIKAINATVDAGTLKPQQDADYYLDWLATSDLL